MKQFGTRLTFCLLFFPISVFSQVKNYPQGYFRNPLNIPMQLVANFGELRANHWHMGLDIRTMKRENLSVYAAADGYISKVKIEPGGFGRAIYINHPKGYTTLYAHLNNFSPALENYVKTEQYRLQSWAVELNIPPALFPVAKGDFIAYSGNTGGSQGPHVHFEIRDTKTDDCLNPLLFGFPVADAVPPTISRLAMYDRNLSVYAQSPKFLPVTKAGSGYTLASKVLKVSSNKISFAIGATDRLSGSTNPNGIYSARILMDGVLASEFILDDINYNETRYLNAHIDYRLKINGGSYVQHLSRMPGDTTTIYTPTANDGVLIFADSNIHDVRIETRDANQNLSVLSFSVQYVPAVTSVIRTSNNVMAPHSINVYESPSFELSTSEYAIYDTVPIVYNETNAVSAYAVSALHSFCSPAIPVHDSVQVLIKPNAPVGDIGKVIIKNTSGTKTVVEKVKWQNGWMGAKFRQLGTFQAFIDNEPPTINAPPPLVNSLSRIVFVPKDNFKTIKSFRAELDGQWLRFTNDKGVSHIYKVDEKFTLGEHQLKVIIEDVAGNITIKEWTVRRG